EELRLELECRNIAGVEADRSLVIRLGALKVPLEVPRLSEDKVRLWSGVVETERLDQRRFGVLERVRRRHPALETHADIRKRQPGIRERVSRILGDRLPEVLDAALVIDRSPGLLIGVIAAAQVQLVRLA